MQIEENLALAYAPGQARRCGLGRDQKPSEKLYHENACARFWAWAWKTA
jgi:hypothetical protein